MQHYVTFLDASWPEPPGRIHERYVDLDRRATVEDLHRLRGEF